MTMKNKLLKIITISVKKIFNAFGLSVVRNAKFYKLLEVATKERKYTSELNYWIGRYNADDKTFHNGHYEKLMLAMAQEKTDGFLKNKIVADFGCGPRGSLVWTQSPSLKIGIDVLVDQYFDTFGDTLIHHNYVYVKSTERHIPVPSEFVDVVYTMNAMDHTENFSTMASEVLRILKRGGIFVGSFNLNEPPTATEPLTLTEPIVKEHLLNKLDVVYTKIAVKDKTKGHYDNFFDPSALPPKEHEESVLWLRGIKL